MYTCFIFGQLGRLKHDFRCFKSFVAHHEVVPIWEQELFFAEGLIFTEMFDF